MSSVEPEKTCIWLPEGDKRTFLGNLFSNSTPTDFKDDLAMRHTMTHSPQSTEHPLAIPTHVRNSPTSPILERSLTLTHSRLVSFHTNRDIREDPHPAFSTFDGLDLPLDGDFGGRELFGCETDGGEESEAVGSELKGRAFC